MITIIFQLYLTNLREKKKENYIYIIMLHNEKGNNARAFEVYLPMT